MTPVQFILEWVVRSFLLILAGALLVWLLRAKSPSVRLMAWTVVLAGSLAIPIFITALPQVPLHIRRAPASLSGALPPTARPALQYLPWLVTSDLASARAARARPAKPVNRMRLVAILYAMAAAALLLRLVAGVLLSTRILSRSRLTGIPVDGAEIRESDFVASPVTIGVLRPAILLPLDWRDWDSAKLDAVLAHECSHVRRRDPAVQFFSEIHRALLWANPLSWYLHRNIVQSAEEISDDDAIAATRDRVFYAGILLEFMQRGVGQASWFGVTMARYERPERRIHRILNSTAYPRRVTRWGIAAILGLGAPLAWLAAAAEPQSATPRPAPLPAPAAAAPSPGLSTVPAPMEAPAHSVEPHSPVSPSPEPLPAFEVATVKPADLNSGHMCCITIRPGARMEIHAQSLKNLISTAFGLPQFQIFGGDAWIDKDEYDIEAKPSDNSLASIKTLRYTWYGIEDEHLRQMLQALLIDRFQLKFHRVTKAGVVYLLERSGKPLTLHLTDTPRGIADPAGYGNIGYVAATWSIYAYSMPQLAKFATDFIVHTPVLDRTELSGSFDYKERQPDLEPNYGPDQTDTFLNFLSELGLKLERSKGPIESFVIDHAARPSPN